ncbi:alpha/beta hydrolase [Nesterenkonia halobia]|uniref:Alpha/beta fold hydrolase n=1 Tax=Nesterenkonia halobia TaxID=37922 RepID=A0ABP6RD25_9MICC
MREDAALPDAPRREARRAAPQQDPARPDGVLLLHGFTSAPSTMAPVAEALEQAGFLVETPLLPGHGTAWRDLARTPRAALTDSALSAWDGLARRCRTVGVAGLSMGGTLALQVAARRPVSAAAVINPALRLRPGQGLAARLLWRLMPSVGSIAGDIARAGVREEAYPRTPVRGVAELDRLAAEVRAELGAVEAPVLLLRSAQDGVLPRAAAASLGERLTGASLREVVLRRSRHVATLDHDAERVAAEVRGFLTGAADRRVPRNDETAEAEDR